MNYKLHFLSIDIFMYLINKLAILIINNTLL